MSPSFTVGLLASVAWLSLSTGCSDFRLNDTHAPSSVLSARTMDFDVDLKSVAEVIPRGTVFQELPALECPDCPDYSWESKYGFVAMNVWGLNTATDGMNERGLSAAWLYLVGTEYPMPKHEEAHQEDDASDVDASHASEKPVITSLCSYLLGNFATVEEVRKGLEQIQIAEFDERIQIPLLRYNTGLQRIPLHVSVHDAEGNSLVVEFLHGKTKIYNNTNEVLTNDPPLSEQIKNFKKNGLDHLPGGYSSKARFVRLSVLNHLAGEGYDQLAGNPSYLQATNEQREVSNAIHVLNSVVLPPIGSATQWSIVRDHGRRKLYLQATMNQVVRVIDFAQIDFANPSSRKLLPVAFGNWFVDITPALIAEANHARTMDLPPRSQLEALLRHLLGGANGGSFPPEVQNLSAMGPQSSSMSGIWIVFLGGSLCGAVAAFLVVLGRRVWKRHYARRYSYARIKDPEEIKYRSA